MTITFVNQRGSPTWEFYQAQAEQYAKQTADVDMSPLYERFERHLPKVAMILDAGSGSGRDTKHFLDAGFAVSAFDYSSALANISTEFTGVATDVRSFADINEIEKYDGIWACASLLHLPMVELPNAIGKLANALRPLGALYMSFRYGDGERCHSDGRCYSDLNESGMKAMLKKIPSLELAELWVSGGEGSFEGSGRWLNAIVRKIG